MDKQRIFWVILAVAGMAVVVLVAGVFLLRPKAAGAATPLTDQGMSPYEYQKATPPGGQEPKQSGPEVVKIVIGEQTGNALGSSAGAAAEPIPASPKAEAKPVATAKPAAQPAVKPVIPPAVKPAAKPAAKPAVKPAVKPARTEYWIQTASYKSQGAAEDLSRKLADKGLTGRVFSSDQKSETWYRVRIGPYADKQEAEKFLGMVKQIQGLEAAMYPR